jgi:hypothetical protein
VDGTPDAWVAVVRTNLIDKTAWCALVLALGAGCANPGLAWAPRYPGPDRPPTNEESVQVVQLGRPSCPYAVIGTAFGTSLDELREIAAAHGGNGVYDTSCFVETKDHFYFKQAHGQCDGRVYVCTGPAALPSTGGNL